MGHEERGRAREELSRVIEMLDGMGVDYSLSEPYFLSFANATGECMCFPSQTEDGKLVIAYQVRERHDTAEQVLASVGLLAEDGR